MTSYKFGSKWKPLPSSITKLCRHNCVTGPLRYCEREETCCHHIGYSFQLASRVLLCASSHRQDSTYHGLCYTSCRALAGLTNSSMDPQWCIDLMTHHSMSKRYYHGATSRSLYIIKVQADCPGYTHTSFLSSVYRTLDSVFCVSCILAWVNRV